MYGRKTWICREEEFSKIQQSLLSTNECVIPKDVEVIFMPDFYQHDLIYRAYRTQILEYVRGNPSHTVTTDSTHSGDFKQQEFRVTEIVNTPISFESKYNTVLHVRLGDFVSNNDVIPIERYLALFENYKFNDTVCIVCENPKTKFEIEFLHKLRLGLDKHNIKYMLQSDNLLNDYYTMKEAETLICSNSTLCWIACLFSTKLKVCYFPSKDLVRNGFFSKPHENTLYF